MGSHEPKWRTALAIVAPMVVVASQAPAEPISRTNWVPNVGNVDVLSEDIEEPLGDLWTFQCPPGDR
jgi:hypothetical protein